MTNEESNPYAAPLVESHDVMPGGVDPVLVKKAEAIIKDAGQFWLAILMCIVCTALGAIIIGPWYLVRLLQWSSLAKGHPELMVPNAPRGSLAQRFQSAKIKLIIGICFGGLILLTVALLFTSAVLLSSNG